MNTKRGHREREARREAVRITRETEGIWQSVRQRRARATWQPATRWRVGPDGIAVRCELPREQQWVALKHYVQEFTGTLPTPKQYAEFHANVIAPAMRLISGNTVGRCEGCGEPVVATRPDQRFCSDTCSARNRNRGRNKIASAAQRHFARCARCSTGKPCKDLERLAATGGRRGDAMGRRTAGHRGD